MIKIARIVQLVCIVLIVLLQSSALQAGETGKIAGKIVDKQTGEPLIGASIIVDAKWVDESRVVELDKPLGAAANVKGEYFILNIPPGKYNLRTSYIGYKKEIITGVKVSVDKTTQVNFQLSSEVIVSEEIIITAFRSDKVETDLTATKQTYDIGEVLSSAGIADITDIIALQADVVGENFRGGRAGEALYLVGGATIVNPLNNRRAFQPIVTGLEQVEVYTSGFSAEYGNVQSGVVNMVTKEGGNKWTTRMEASSTLPYYKNWEGSVYDPQNLDFYNLLNNPGEWLEPDPEDGKPLYDRGFGFGPLYLPPRVVFPPDTLHREDSLKIAELGRIAWLMSVRDVGLEYNNNFDYRLDFSTGGPISKNGRVFVAARQNIIHPVISTPIPDTERQLMSNISYRLNNDDKLKFTYAYDYQFTNQIGSQFLRWMFDRTLSIRKTIQTSQQYGLEWNHVFTPAAFMNWKFSVLKTLLQDRVELLNSDQLLEDYSSGRNWVDYTGPSDHRVGRVEDDRGDERSNSYSLSGSMTSQLNTNHLLKTGLQLFYYDLDVRLQANVTSGGALRNVNFKGFPYEGAIYFQDKMEFEGIIANLGLRYDFYDFNTKFPTNYFSPFNSQKTETEYFSQLQPRIGISFPVSDKSVFHLNYGVFTQRANFYQTFYGASSSGSSEKSFGNSLLKPESTNAYDVGLVRGFPYGFYLDVSAYYKDVANLVETAFYVNEKEGEVFRSYINRDYANIKGFHINLEKNTGFIRGYLRYNWESASGKSSNDLDAPVTFRENQETGESEIFKKPDPEDVLLNFDRTHKAVFNFRIKTSSNDGPIFRSFRPFANLSLSHTLRILSGRPYTFDETGQGLKFNKRTPTESDLRIRLEKRIKIGINSLTAYAEAFNILNKKVYSYSRTFNDSRNTVRWEVDRENILIEDENAPYLTSQAVYIIDNEPTHYRLGLIFNF